MNKRLYIISTRLLIAMAVSYLSVQPVAAQELQVKFNVNSQQVEGTDKSVFENLQQTVEQWMNDRQ